MLRDLLHLLRCLPVILLVFGILVLLRLLGVKRLPS